MDSQSSYYSQQLIEALKQNTRMDSLTRYPTNTHIRLIPEPKQPNLWQQFWQLFTRMRNQ